MSFGDYSIAVAPQGSVSGRTKVGYGQTNLRITRAPTAATGGPGLWCPVTATPWYDAKGQLY